MTAELDAPTTDHLTQATAKIVLAPIEHFTGSRLTHRTFRAHLAPRDGSNDLAFPCPHAYGHRSVDAASSCGRGMWRRLK